MGGRWRKLEGSDPATYDLIQKVQLLQRRLIRASEKVVERDLQIREKEQLCLHLQAVIRRTPGEEAAEKLLLTQVTGLLVRSPVRAVSRKPSYPASGPFLPSFPVFAKGEECKLTTHFRICR